MTPSSHTPADGGAQRKRTVRQRVEDALWERYERDGAATKTKEEWDEWVNSLPVEEFMAMMSLRKDYVPPPLSEERRDLCVRLAAVAAFNLDEWPAAQKLVYRAIKEIQRL